MPRGGARPLQAYYSVAAGAGPRPVCMARVMTGILLRPLKNGVVADLRAALTLAFFQQHLSGAG